MRELTTPTSPKPNAPHAGPKFADWLGFNTCNDPELEKALSGAKEWAASFKRKESPRWLSLVGSSGTGKTHIVRKLFAYAREQTNETRLNFIPHVVYWPDFVQKLRAGDAFEKREDMKRWPVLALDDIGSERDPSGFASEELNTLLGCRMGRWTLLTSNLDIDRLGKIDERIASRLIRGRNICVQINTVDYSTR